MSLLMDALKRAEEAKRQQAHASPDGGRETGPIDGMALEPLAEDSGRPSALPDLQSHQDALDKDLRDAADFVDLALAKPTASTSEARAAAHNVFLAKAPAIDEARRQRKSILLTIGLGCLGGLGIAGYFWYQLQAVSKPSGLLGAPATQYRPVQAQASGPIAGAPASLPGLPGGESSRPSAAAAAAPAAGSAPMNQPAPATRAPRPAQTGQRLASPAPAPAQRAPAVSAGRAEEAPVARAYAAWQAGNFDTARSLYGQALADAPRDIDALLGAATVAAYDGDRARAESLFSRVLDIDPRNPNAHAGLLALRGAGDANQAESRLKTLLGQTADSAAAAALHFALGNVYAEQQRWREAQQAYFRAYVGDADNPDYAFNLAVSLDRLEQRAAARKYYETALQLLARRPGAFDRQAVEARLAQLTP